MGTHHPPPRAPPLMQQWWWVLPRCAHFWGRGGGGGRARGGILHGGLVAEHDFQFLAVEFSPVREVHDALPVVGELLDVHLLQGMGEGGGVGEGWVPRFSLGGAGKPPPALAQPPMGTQASGPASRPVPREQGHGVDDAAGEGRSHGRGFPRVGGVQVGHPGSVPHFFFPTYFLILLIQVFQKCIQLVLINEAAPVLDNKGGRSAGGRTRVPQTHPRQGGGGGPPPTLTQHSQG